MTNEPRLSPLDCSVITEEMTLVLCTESDGGGYPSTNPEWVSRTYTVTASRYDLTTLNRTQLKQLAEWLNCDSWAAADLRCEDGAWTLSLMDF